MIQEKTIKILKIWSITTLIIVTVVFIIVFANITMTMKELEESDKLGEPVSHSDPVVAILFDLRNLRAAADLFRKDNLDKLDTIKPELELLAHYIGNLSRFTKTPGEYIITNAGGKWWVGYNLLATEKYSNDRLEICEKLRAMAQGTIFGSMDISVPYDKEDIVFMPVL